MEITKQRKQQIVNQLLIGANSVYNYDIKIDEDIFLNEHESNLVKEKLSKHFDIYDRGSDFFIKNISVSLKNAKKNYPELKKEMKDTIKQEMSFVSRNASFIAIGGLVLAPAITLSVPVITHGIMMINGAIVFASSMPFGMRITEKIGVGLSSKEKVEFKALLNYEFELSTLNNTNANEPIKRKKPAF